MVDRRREQTSSDRRVSDRQDDGWYSRWHPFVSDYGFYDPMMAGSIDGTDEIPHDRAVSRALSASYRPKGCIDNHDPKAVLFIGRLPFGLKSDDIQKALADLLTYGSKSSRSRRDKLGFRSRCRSRSPFSDVSWPKIHLVCDLVSGYRCGYGFAYFASSSDAELVLRNWSQTGILQHQKQIERCGLDVPDGDKIILEPAFGTTFPGWRPRRLGGGLGGRKESGQLRFGGIARPFRRPFTI